MDQSSCSTYCVIQCVAPACAPSCCMQAPQRALSAFAARALPLWAPCLASLCLRCVVACAVCRHPRGRPPVEPAQVNEERWRARLLPLQRAWSVHLTNAASCRWYHCPPSTLPWFCAGPSPRLHMQFERHVQNSGLSPLYIRTYICVWGGGGCACVLGVYVCVCMCARVHTCVCGGGVGT